MQYDPERIKRLKEQYPPGTRIELIGMDDPYSPVPPGTQGEVTRVDDGGTLHMIWDNGRTLGVIPRCGSVRGAVPPRTGAGTRHDDGRAKPVSEFTVEISRPGEFGIFTSATLELPATQAEYHDAMEKARTTEYKATYATELLSCERGWLRPHIPENINLLELNLLAIRMDKYIKDEMDVFEGMVKIETKRNGGEPIPLPRLINMTFSTENCHVAGNITNDIQLGKFLFDNDMLPEEVRDFAVARIFWGSETEDERFKLIGARHRQRENGVFTASGHYVEFDGSVNEAYISHLVRRQTGKFIAYFCAYNIVASNRVKCFIKPNLIGELKAILV